MVSFGPRNGCVCRRAARSRSQFDDGQLVKAFADRLGQGRRAGADFNHRLAFLRVNRRDDAVDHKLIVEEVLPEAFTG